MLYKNCPGMMKVTCAETIPANILKILVGHLNKTGVQVHLPEITAITGGGEGVGEWDWKPVAAASETAGSAEF